MSLTIFCDQPILLDDGYRVEVNVTPSMAHMEPEAISRFRDRLSWKITHWKMQKGLCYYCGHNVAVKLMTLDHYIPLSAGGPDTFENTVAACIPCNRAKANNMPDEFVVPA